MNRTASILATLPLLATLGLFLHKETRSSAVVSPSGTPDGTMTRTALTEVRPDLTSVRQLVGKDKAERLSMPLQEDFLDRAVEGESFHIRLPDGRDHAGKVTLMRRDEDGVLFVQGRFDAPERGRFYFQRQTMQGVAGKLAGNMIFDGSGESWKVEPAGPGGAAALVQTPLDGVICANYRIALPEQAGIEQAPEAHPIDIPIPHYQTIVPLESLPGAEGVIYLDFDGEAGPFPGWGEFDAEAPGVSNAQVHEVWKMVCEDFQGFNLNVTTDRKVFDHAAAGHRQHVVITPTIAASPDAGGVAYVGSYNWSTSTVCWAFYSSGKVAAEVISHELGHALGLSHDGRILPPEDYYYGHGSGETGWAPIMGAGYYENLTQWSKGEYAGASRTQDDLALITSNNSVNYRADDTGDDFESSSYLEILPDNSVANEGIIECTSDVDCYRFKTSGGAVEIQVKPVAANPNLDVMAELVDATTGDYLMTVNPQEELGATIATVLPAGEYVVEVSGTGKGNPLEDGYSDYGSLGTYFISGTVEGGVKPERFTVAENPALDFTVGTVAPRNDHGTAALSWAILSGNEDAIFSIDPATGEIRVIDPSGLDYERLSSRWDDPATFELLVSITDAANASLSETIRVVVSISDANEAPVMEDATVTLLERTRPGTALFTMLSTDVDRFDQLAFEIISGNESGLFTIDPGSGVIAASAAGLGEIDGAVQHTLTLRVTDVGGASDTATLGITIIDIPSGLLPGGVIRTYFEGIPGSSVAGLINATTKYPDYPDSEEFLTAFDGLEHGDNYGSTVRGYFIPPVSGSYLFWISSDGSSQLWFDASNEQSGASQIASVIGGTEHYHWGDSSPYQSSPVTLIAGQAYSIEALHKESTGTDHVAVAFSGPGIPKQLLGGKYLVPYQRNYPPQVQGAILTIEETAFAGQNVGTVSALDTNPGDTHGNFTITAGNAGEVFSIDPASGMIRVAAGGVMDADVVPSYTLTLQVTDSGSPPLSGSGQVTINVLPEGSMPDRGLVQQIWNEVPGDSVEELLQNERYPYFPTSTRLLPSLESLDNPGQDYGSRIQALLTPETSGYYTFYLSSNDSSSLVLSPDASESSGATIAGINGWSDPGEWTKYPGQQSEPIYLEAGKDYYIGALQKNGTGDGHVQVAWTGPGFPTITVIPGTHLRPFDINQAPAFDAASASFEILRESLMAGMVVSEGLAKDPENEALIYRISSGNEAGAFAIDPASGTLSIVDPLPLLIGAHQLRISVQDRGLGGGYPFKSASLDVTVTILSGNRAPAFAVESESAAVMQDEALEGQWSAYDPDAGDVLVFSKESGPSWLVIEPSGAMHGVPANEDVGTHVVVIRVTDHEGLYDELALTVEVANVNDAPVFMSPSLALGDATQDVTYMQMLSGAASDADAGDELSYSKISGPEWVSIAADGTVTGVPGKGDVGISEVVVRATDKSGAFGEALLWIVVVNVNDPPVFLAPILALPEAAEDEEYAVALANHVVDPDPGESLSFELVSGPPWLGIANDGSLQGKPPGSQVGTNLARVRVTDAAGLSAEATLVIEVVNVNDAPLFLHNPVQRSAGEEELPYEGTTLDGEAMDEDLGDTLSFSKIEGPEWLEVASDGSLSGTPPAGSAGLQVFVIRVSDAAGAYAEAGLLIDVTGPDLPLPWSDSQIGSGEVTGSSVHGNGEFDVSGAGELAGRSDSFQFVWQPLGGNGSITARVASVSASGSLSRAGVMIRDTLASNSRHVFLGVTEEGGFRWIRRTGFNGNTSTNSSGSAAFPNAWVRLTRNGSVITAYKSMDGEAWTPIGSLTADFPETCYFGLAVASGSQSLLHQAHFSNVSIAP
ncbi:cadherin domain-containing protein [Luteolibacter luteus]|uniref:Uncharacterized protein n=1 Tax=Luteolibacter luteus TaxID=2728835 RepID=A0A858RPJ3_9BACT|nr:cadherin domain-containing protein [Luteolibacter luteus]QJE98937.1 hypothetical protein HHL09_25210 [Luteolibacter luteus]